MGKNVTKNQRQAEENQKKNHKNRLIAGIILIVVAAGAAGAGVWAYLREEKNQAEAPDTSNYEAVLKNYYTAILSADGQLLSQVMAPPEYWTYYMETYDKTEDDVVSTFADGCNTTLTEWQEAYGTDVKVTYQIIGLSAPAQEGIDEWNSNMEETLGNDGAEISEAVVLEVERTYSGSTKTGKDVTYPTLGKIGDNWYIIEEDNEELQGETATDTVE